MSKENQPIVLSTVQRHFSVAKEIKPLNMDMIISISGIRNFEFHESDKSWRTPGGQVTVWRLNEGYAKIVTKKCGNCKKCKCNEKK